MDMKYYRVPIILVSCYLVDCCKRVIFAGVQDLLDRMGVGIQIQSKG